MIFETEILYVNH